MRFDGRVALVTGAGGGIGRSIAGRLAADGAEVVCADVVEAAASDAAAAVVARGGRARSLRCDVTSEASCTDVVARAADGGRLDVLVNAAGVGSMGHTDRVGLAEWERVLAVNLTGTFLMCRVSAPPLLEVAGCIVNIASSAALRPTAYNAAYAASKAGVVMLTKVLAVEYSRRGLRANCVAPGSVDTAFLEELALPDDASLGLLTRSASLFRRNVQPDEVAAAVAYLASDDAAMVTGATLVIDGGATA